MFFSHTFLLKQKWKFPTPKIKRHSSLLDVMPVAVGSLWPDIKG
jgi:hypothetical protein